MRFHTILYVLLYVFVAAFVAIIANIVIVSIQGAITGQPVDYRSVASISWLLPLSAVIIIINVPSIVVAERFRRKLVRYYCRMRDFVEASGKDSVTTHFERTALTVELNGKKSVVLTIVKNGDEPRRIFVDKTSIVGIGTNPARVWPDEADSWAKIVTNAQAPHVVV